MANNILIVGSLNLDTVLEVERLPKNGETISVKKTIKLPGGKGANQAVAASRLGSKVAFVGRVGNDEAGSFMIDTLKEDHIIVDDIQIDEKHETGSAEIIVDKYGSNEILVYGGANKFIDDQEFDFNKICNADFVISQFETNTEFTEEAFKKARELNVKTILNLAPAGTIDAKLISLTDILVVNESECEFVTTVKIKDNTDVEKASEKLSNLGFDNFIITLGSKGLFYKINKNSGFMDAIKVDAIDTTGAGDAFIGALACELKPDFSNIEQTLEYAQEISSKSVQVVGAIDSLPYK